MQPARGVQALHARRRKLDRLRCNPSAASANESGL
jgi:hypothetical protein